MRRIFWVALGAAAGVIAVRALNRQVQRLAPEALGGLAGRAAEGWQDFTSSVREAMAEREGQLRDELGLDGAEGGAAAWTPAPRRAGSITPRLAPDRDGDDENELPYTF